MAASERRSRNRVKLTRKELKAPDEFLTLSGRLLTFASEHLRLISSVLGVVVACILTVWGLLVYVDHLERQAFATLAQIETHLRDIEHRDALPSPLMDRLQEITHTLGAGRARGYAQLYLAHSHYRKGDYAAALAAYRQASAQTDQRSLLWPLATLGVGYALEAAGDFNGAQDAYQRVIDANPAGFVTEAYVGKGRAAEGSNDLQGAIATYAAVIDKFPYHAEALGIADKLAALKARVERSMGQ